MSNVERLYILDFGLFQVHQNGRIIGIPGYLIQTADGQNILVDTGFHPKYADDPHKATLEDKLESFGRVLSLTKDNLPPAQLAKIGLGVDDIDLLIMTHTDIDHVGGIGDFTGVPIVIHKDERAFDRPRYWGDQKPLEWPNVPYQLIDQDCELAPGLKVITSSGHAPGHLSLLLELPHTGAVLLTGDAIGRPEEIELSFAGSWDEEMAQASGEKLMKIAAETGAFIIYGHDPEQWATLKKAPDFYS